MMTYTPIKLNNSLSSLKEDLLCAIIFKLNSAILKQEMPQIEVVTLFYSIRLKQNKSKLCGLDS